MEKLLSKMKIFHLLLLVLSGLIIISALPFKTQYNSVYVNVSTTIEEASGEDQNVALNQNQANLFNFFELNPNSDFEFDHDFNNYKVTVYNFEQDLNDYNNLILWFGIISIIGVALLYVFSNNNRRIYYKTNLIASLIYTAVFLVLGIVLIVNSFSLISQINDNYDLFNYVSVLQNPETSTTAYQKSITAVDADGNLAVSLDYIRSEFDVNVTTLIGYDIFFVIAMVYVVFVCVLSVMKYKATAKRREELAKVVPVND